MDRPTIDISEEEWIKYWRREAPEKTLENYKAVCREQLNFLVDHITPFLAEEK